MKGTLIVRKYKNRRLYDTERSIHITLEELLELIRGGREVKVLEPKTGEDVTVETLFQLLLVESRETLKLLPAEFVHFLIRTKESSLSLFFKSYFGPAWQNLVGLFQQGGGQGGFMPPMMNPFWPPMGAWPYAGRPATLNPPTPEAPPPAVQSENDESVDLKRKIAALERQLADLSGKPRKTRTRRKGLV